MYKLFNVSYNTFTSLHDFYLPRTIITESIYNDPTALYTLTISNNAIIKINDGNITIDLGGKLYTIDRNDYSMLIIE